MENEKNYIHHANDAICRVAENQSLEAERLRWIAEVAGMQEEVDLQGEIVRRWESINRLVAPPEWYFIGFNKYPDMTTVKHRVAVLKGALKDAKYSRYADEIEEHIEALEATLPDPEINCPACMGAPGRHNHETWEDLHPARETGFESSY